MNNIDNLLDELHNRKEINPSHEFIEKLEKKALSFTEMRVKYGKKMILIIIMFIASIILINAFNIKLQNSANSKETTTSSDYNLVPANTVDYE